MILLATGDVCGEGGLRVVRNHLRALKKLYGADICVVNGENADILGIRPDQAAQLYDAGADVVTLGNHAFRKNQILRTLEDERWLLRPANYAPQIPGWGHTLLQTPSGRRLCVVNLLGRLNCDWNVDSPFAVMETILQKREADFYAVDFHAEATSEKNAFAHHFDGRIAVVFGTHTHVQTSDERVLPGGTGFITDVGMAGAVHSILGVKIEQSVGIFLGNPPVRMESPAGPAQLEGALFEIDETTGRCVRVERLRVGE